MIHTIDLEYLGVNSAIASYLIETEKGPILIETGPYSTFPTLKAAVEKHGYKIQDVQHVFLTHIHLDHAGSAWAFADHGATIYVHPFGAKNMEDPTRLMESATRIYGDQMDRLWGTMKKISATQLHEVQNEEVFHFGDTTLKAWYTPGHAKHHIAWQTDDLIFTGDVAGVKINDGPVVPPCPPPDINIEQWLESIQLIKKLKPSKLYLTHYEFVSDVDHHLGQLEDILGDWAGWIKSRWENGETAEELTPLFSKYTNDQLRKNGVDERTIKIYEAANPSWMSVAGLIRYWKKRAES